MAITNPLVIYFRYGFKIDGPSGANDMRLKWLTLKSVKILRRMILNLKMIRKVFLVLPTRINNFI